MKPTYSDEYLIEEILAGGSRQEAGIRKLYKQYFHLTQTSRSKYQNLEDEDLLIAYNSSILSVRRQIIRGAFRGDSTLWTYLNRVFINKCIDIIRKQSSNRETVYEQLPETDPVFQVPTNVFDDLVVQDRMKQLIGKMDELGEPCKQIILDSEYWGYSPDEIAHRVGFSNAKSVNSKKYTCLQRLRKLLQASKAA